MSKTILLVEDDQDILDIMYYMLTDAGYGVLRSMGEDALELTQNHRPDLVILDHRLRSIWGADICRALKNNPGTAHIPVIMVSAAMNVEHAAQEAGADHVLLKPFGMHEMLQLVADTLAKHPGN